MWQGKVPSLASFSFSMLLLKGNVMGNTGALWASCIVMLWLNAALIWQMLFMLARTNNFFTGLVSLLFRAHKVLPFLNCIQDRNSAREVGLYFSFTLMAHVHNAGDVIPPICSCIHAGWFFFTQTRTMCQPHSAGSFFTWGFISGRERGDVAERDEATAQSSRREMKIN